MIRPSIINHHCKSVESSLSALMLHLHINLTLTTALHHSYIDSTLMFTSFLTVDQTRD